MRHIGTCMEIGRKSSTHKQKSLRKSRAELFEELLAEHKAMIERIVLRFKTRKIDSRDLRQEGILALMRAVKTFARQDAVEFGTHAEREIEKAIRKYIAREHKASKAVRNVRLLFGRLKRTARRLWRRFGRLPTFKEISRAMGCSLERIERALQFVVPGVRLAKPACSEEAIFTSCTHWGLPHWELPDDVAETRQAIRGAWERVGSALTRAKTEGKKIGAEIGADLELIMAVQDVSKQAVEKVIPLARYAH